MKKIISIALVAMMIAVMFVLPSSAAATNAKVSINYTATTKAPKIDGKVATGEYGTKIHSIDYTKDEFVSKLDADKSIKGDFYMTWTDDSLYMAWVLKADQHYPVSKDVDYNADGKKGTETDLMYMWQFSCVQFMLSTGAPDATKKVYQTAEWSGNYLEVGLSIMADGDSYKVAWSKPTGGEGLETDDWDFVGIRNDAAKTTTYEIRLPWNKTGIKKVGNDIKFGLTYAISDQQDYNKTPSMCEWQDAILGGKNMDAGAVITLKGKSDPTVSDISMVIDSKPTSSATTSSEATVSTETSSVVSEDSAAVSSDATSDVSADSKATSTVSTESKATSADTSKPDDGGNTTLWIGLGVVALLGIGGASYFFIAKKKK